MGALSTPIEALAEAEQDDQTEKISMWVKNPGLKSPLDWNFQGNHNLAEKISFRSPLQEDNLSVEIWLRARV